MIEYFMLLLNLKTAYCSYFSIYSFFEYAPNVTFVKKLFSGKLNTLYTGSYFYEIGHLNAKRFSIYRLCDLHKINWQIIKWILDVTYTVSFSILNMEIS